MFCFADKIEGLSPGHSLLENFEGLLQRAKGEDGGVFATPPDSGITKRLLLIKENQISQVNDISLYRKIKSVGSLKSFPWYAPQLSGISILFFPFRSSLMAHHRGGFSGLESATSFV